MIRAPIERRNARRVEGNARRVDAPVHPLGRSRAARGLVALLVLGLGGCVAAPARNVSQLPPGIGNEAREAIQDGVRLYESGEYAMAAQRFEHGADLADRLGDEALAWRAVAAGCTSWLLARQLREFDACSVRLERVQARAHEASGGTNALIALGAVAGGRAQPAVNVPRAVRSVVRPRPEDL